MSANPKFDSRNRTRGVWLVKVPKYLSQRWQLLAGAGEVGRLRVTKKPKGEPEVTLHLSKAALTAQSSSGATSTSADKMPEEHRFVINDLHQQTLAILSEDKSGVPEADMESGKLSIEGRVVRKAECRPPPSDNYMKMKIMEIKKSNQSEKTVKLVDKAVVKYKPVSQHAEAVQATKVKKEGRNVRLDKQQLVELLFHAFEKHQFYKLVDLARVTQQPASYVKEALNEIAQYNTNPPHRYTWELKPEYRHYHKDSE